MKIDQESDSYYLRLSHFILFTFVSLVFVWFEKRMSIFNFFINKLRNCISSLYFMHPCTDVSNTVTRLTNV